MRGRAVVFTSTSAGPCRAGNVAVTRFVEVSNTEMVLSAKLATYAIPLGVIARFQGLLPTVTKPVRVRPNTSITATVFEKKSATYAREPSGVKAIPRGLGPAGIALTMVFVLVSTSFTT